MKILCYGDSNTYGWDPSDFIGGPYKMPWPKLLAQMTGAEVINQGQPGREIPTREKYLTWLADDLEKNQPLDYLLIMLGSNDALYMFHPGVDLIAERMEKLLAFLQDKKKETKIILIAPPRMEVPEAERNSVGNALGPAYQKLADRYDCLFADAGQWNLDLMFDGVHLTEQAHVVFAEQVANLIEKHIGDE